MPKSKSKVSLEEIYTLIVESLKTVMPNIEDELDYYQKLDCKSWSDDKFVSVMARTVFTAGFRDKTVENRWPAITKAFSNFNIHKVARYTEKDVQKLLSKPKIIKNKSKIRAVITNAKKMEEIIKKHGSFANYISSFSSSPDNLIEELRKIKFKWIREVGIYEFVKEMCFPFIKPDRQIRKVFHRLGLIDKEASPEEIVQKGKAMAEAVNERPCVVDCVLWHFGKRVCTDKPECEKCGLINVCEFHH